MPTSKYKQCWPETVILWGAGATKQLGLPTTQQIAEILITLAKGKPDCVKFFHCQKWDKKEDIGAIRDLLNLMSRDNKKRNEAAENQFQHLSPKEREKRLQEFSDYYDWDTLKKIIKVCPGAKDGKIEATDLFNIIDLHTQTKHGFRTGKNRDEFIQPERLIPARNALKLIIQTIMFIAWKMAIKNKEPELQQYRSFCEHLSREMQKEAKQLELAGHPLNERSFFLFSHAFISMNWDPVLMWLKHNAHKELNGSWQASNWRRRPAKLQLMDDLIHFQAVRQVDDQTNPGVLYPCNEAVVQRINRTTTESARILRVCRYYYPHGCLSWRECPNCGKLMSSIGDDWNPFSETLIPPPPLPSLVSSELRAWADFWRSEEEKNCEKSGKPDVLQCPFCSEITETRHTPLIMQSSLKGEHPPYIEEIQRDMRVLLENAHHIVLLGYSLPKDDFIYRAVLSARKNEKVKCSIVNYDKEVVAAVGNKWFEGSEVKKMMEKAPAPTKGNPQLWRDTVKQAASLFGEENVRINLSGVPGVFLEDKSSSSSAEQVNEILHPEFAFGKETIVETRSIFLK